VLFGKFWRTIKQFFELRRTVPWSDARLSRFIYSSSHFIASKNVVKPRAFMPPADGKLSVFDTEHMEDESVWQIGREVAVDRTTRARADIATSAAIARGLKLIVDEPPPRHRNLDGWPPANQKEDQKLIAMELAAVALLRLP
jgi:hypothetical protein